MKLSLDALTYLSTKQAEKYEITLGDEYDAFLNQVRSMVAIVYSDGRWGERDLTETEFLMFTEYPHRVYEAKYGRKE